MSLNLVQDRSELSVWDRDRMRWDRERWLTALAAGSLLVAVIILMLLRDVRRQDRTLGAIVAGGVLITEDAEDRCVHETMLVLVFLN